MGYVVQARSVLYAHDYFCWTIRKRSIAGEASSSFANVGTRKHRPEKE